MRHLYLWLIGAAGILAGSSLSTTYVWQILVLVLTLGIFFGTLFLKKRVPESTQEVEEVARLSQA